MKQKNCSITRSAPCKVEGRVQKGERLVSGSKPGFAKALGSNDYDVRCIIGRSLVEKIHLMTKLLKLLLAQQLSMV